MMMAYEVAFGTAVHAGIGATPSAYSECLIGITSPSLTVDDVTVKAAIGEKPGSKGFDRFGLTVGKTHAHGACDLTEGFDAERLASHAG